MKYFYFGLYLLALLAAVRLATVFTQAVPTTTQQIGPSEPGPEEATSNRESSELNAGFASTASANAAGLSQDWPADENSSHPVPVVSAFPEFVSKPGESAANLSNAPAVRHSASLHETMITPGNFEYCGAIRPPHIEQNGSRFSYGGWGVAYRADGDPNGPDDGLPGSLFLVGHQSHQMVAEISIPVPVISKSGQIDDLPVAEIMQSFSDVTGGLLKEMTGESSESFRIGGLMVTNGLLHWTMFKYYNVENIDYPSHGTSNLDLQFSRAEGLWHLGPMNSGIAEWHSYKHAGYIFEIPTAESNKWFGGRNLISGLQISTGLQASSQGPAMFAYGLPPKGTPMGSCLSSAPLVWYSMDRPLAQHHPSDRWTGGAWLTLGDKQAVVIAGRKARGEFYYGEARPGDCSKDKGYHGPPYEVELLFYSPASLIHAANGSLPAQGLDPWLRWDCLSEGGGINQYMLNACSQHVGGLAYDRGRNLLYLVQADAGMTRDNEFEPLPIIHVFRIVD